MAAATFSLGSSNHSYTVRRRRLRLPMSLFLLVLVLGYLTTMAGAQAQVDRGEKTELLFPHHEDYDALILDPLHAYGSPYGGFSRATRNRLAALPLHLPALTTQDEKDITNNETLWEPLYTTIRDGTSGQLYACRVYHEDELEPNSLTDSMFDPPILRRSDTTTSQMSSALHHPYDSDGDNDNGDDDDDDDDESQAQSMSASKTTTQAEKDADIVAGISDGGDQAMDSETTQGGDKEGVVPEDNPDDETTSSVGATVSKREALRLLEVANRMKKLKGTCAQIHKGWWSYEWCNEGTLAQFHVSIDPEAGIIEIQDITSLGEFVRREWHMDVATNKEEETANELAGDLKEAARITDIYEGGSMCEETGEPRRATVSLVCCTDDVIAKKARMLRNGDAVLEDLALYDIEEDEDKVCNYKVTICTSLLCVPATKNTNQWTKASAEAAGSTTSTNSQEEHIRRSTPKENESVMEILDRTLGGRKPVCLQSITGGWWTYEYCHEKSVRQFHEVVGTKRDKTGTAQTTRVVETDHNLGRPQLDLFKDIKIQDEWKYMVNATDTNSGKKAYFELEYTDGDICDDHDVRDAAIVAGNTGAKGLARASSVRYTCGERFDIAVSEDSTCHYLVNIVVPDLCRHPFFKIPVSKKQIFKCLPIEDPDVDESTILFG